MLLVVLLIGASILTAGCHDDMYDQPRFEDYEPTPFFEDSMSVRPEQPNTVPRGMPYAAFEHFFRGRVDGSAATAFPLEVTRGVLERGRERFNVYCSPCHGYAGYGDGMVTRRGFSRAPTSFHTRRMRTAPVGRLFDVITNGYGIMYEYGTRIKPADRWAIVAYIRALQLSQNAAPENMPPDVRKEFEGMRSNGE